MCYPQRDHDATSHRAQGPRAKGEQHGCHHQKTCYICPKVYDRICPPVAGMVGSEC